MSERSGTRLSDHVKDVLAREFWRCSGQAENARQEARNSAEASRLFEIESDKWQVRANEILALLGGDVPENPLPGSIE